MRKKVLTLLGVVFIVLGVFLISIRVSVSFRVMQEKDTGDVLRKEFEEFIDSSDLSKDSMDLVGLLQKAFNNPDVIGYLYYPKASISYAIVQGEDNETYLKHNIYGEYSISGSIFLDCGNSEDFSDTSSVIYGHHMRYGEMFGKLEENSSVGDCFYVYTRVGKLVYSVISTETIDSSERSSFVLSGKQSYDVLLPYLKGYSSLDDLENSSKNFVTLVTCHYGGTSDRYGVTGLLQSQEIFKGE